MKKCIILFLMFFGLMGYTKAQEIGVRFGEVIGGNNVAIDGLFATGKFSRVHADVSFGNGVGVDALWDFVYRPLGDEAFMWYAGVGVSTFLGDPFLLGVPGEIGLEYKFKFPMSISLDWRPTLIIIENTDFEISYAGLNIRYVLN
jgi:hypothetical protein